MHINDFIRIHNITNTDHRLLLQLLYNDRNKGSESIHILNVFAKSELDMIERALRRRKLYLCIVAEGPRARGRFRLYFGTVLAEKLCLPEPPTNAKLRSFASKRTLKKNKFDGNIDLYLKLPTPNPTLSQ